MRHRRIFLTEDPTPSTPPTPPAEPTAPPETGAEQITQLKAQIEQLKAQLNFAREALAILSPSQSREEQQAQLEQQQQTDRITKLSNIYKTLGV